MERALLNEGFMLMLVGMGTVFVFLTLLVVAMTLMSTIVQRLAPAPALHDADPDELAAVAAAVQHHRQSRKN